MPDSQYLNQIVADALIHSENYSRSEQGLSLLPLPSQVNKPKKLKPKPKLQTIDDLLAKSTPLQWLNEVTHYACFDLCWSNAIDDMAAYMTAETAEWTADKLYTLADSATEIKSLFAVFRTDTEEEVFTHLNLQRVV